MLERVIGRSGRSRSSTSPERCSCSGAGDCWSEGCKDVAQGFAPMNANLFCGPLAGENSPEQGALAP